MPHLVTIGDSVLWGQGLQDAHKIHRLVANALRARHPNLQEHFTPHSGAIIGAGVTVTRPGVHGEVPTATPTILEQAATFPGDPADVVAVLVNGGINDVDIRTILLPFGPLDALEDLTVEHCFDSMRVLLRDVAQRFPLATTPIVVPGYFPILSPRSSPLAIPLMLAHEGVLLPPALDELVARNLVVERCLLFWKTSEASLQRAVAEVNDELGVARILFVDAGFTERNAVFADEPWLFGLNLLLLPEDEVVSVRRAACNAAIPVFDILARQACHRASAGHPNVTGAAKYAQAIIGALGL